MRNGLSSRSALAGAAVATFVAAGMRAAPEPHPARPALSAASSDRLRSALSSSGRPLVVHVWASWCESCRLEWPALARALRRAEGVDVVTLAVESPASRAEAERVLAGLGRMPGRTLTAATVDVFPAVRRFDPEWDGALPATYLLDASGRVVLAQRGVTRLAQLEEAIGALSKDKGRSRVRPDAKERRVS
jgi:thiol-disulfide isomerase/thioredoxin